MLRAQTVALLAAIAFASVGSYLIISALRLVMNLRTTIDAEVAGIDISE